MSDSAEIHSIPAILEQRDKVSVEIWVCDRIGCYAGFIVRVKHDEQQPIKNCLECGVRVLDNQIK